MKKLCLIIGALVLVLVVISLALTLFQKNIPLRDKVALIRIEGPILDSKNAVDEIKEHAKDSSIKAIILRVDSPGGAVAPSQEIYSEVKKAAAKKAVVVSMGAIAASGGYYISCPATRIIANAGTLTGSIGVIMEIPNIEGLLTKIGVKTEVIKSGKNKDIGSAFRAMKPEERELLQGVMDNVHEQFIRAVAEGRKLKIDDVREIADGRIFTGEQALAKGLVNELGTLEDATKIAAKLGGIKEEPEVVIKKDKVSFIDMLRNNFPKEILKVFPTVQIKYLYSP
ncbi:Signal peptide peptidase SppA, 36K type [Candidatus Sulfobium mesophilum]|uniref:Signal peptide peptidase SppA, 36K type n=1 Tax=Candidatus Sulfobium mesophilum TaxID=2016548 RepID=A0A2U3QKM0_9BACT|nr:Signal peptide peptidase SppA, 36K type [Candidatus Sulfobium mesophilum]